MTSKIGASLVTFHALRSLPHATFRFYQELNEFLPPAQRQIAFEYEWRDTPSIKHLIETLGVPHTEVDLILVNDRSVDWAYQPQQNDRVAVYPVFESLDITPLIRLRPQPLREVRFVLDGHLGRLAAYLRMLGISGIANVLSAIKMAKWYEWGAGDAVITVLTDSMELYGSRLRELTAERGEYTARDAAVSYHQYLMGQDVAYMEELTYPARKRVHNLKYYTWVEQQGKTYDEIQAQWYQKDYWTSIHGEADQIDALIEEFNAETGLL